VILGIQDPIRNALRDLVREKRLRGWAPIKTGDEETRWTVVLPDGTTPPPYTTEGVNDLIGMFWQEAA
jgi:hypothetical protein